MPSELPADAETAMPSAMLAALLARIPGPKVLEISRGESPLTEALVDAYPEVDCVDVSALAPPAGAAAGSLLAGFCPGTMFNDVIAVHRPAQSPRLLREAARWLTPDGRVHLVMAPAPSAPDAPPHDEVLAAGLEVQGSALLSVGGCRLWHVVAVAGHAPSP